jgi:Tol biopolymer transport system component
MLALSVQAAIRSRLASQTSNETPANGHSYVGNGGVLSGDGSRLAFASRADNLPGGDGSTYQMYVRDFTRGRTTLVSKDNNGDPAEAEVTAGAISANGRFVVFYGQGDGLPGGNETVSQVWIHDLKTGTTRLVSKGTDGEPGDAPSSEPAVSATERFVTFYSAASNFPGHDGDTHVYVRDMVRGKSIVASKTNGGQPAYGLSYGQAISSTGRYVAFESFDSDLPGGDGVIEHIYLRDLERRRTILIDRATGGSPADSNSYYPTVSANGGFVAFESDAGNLPGADGVHRQIFLRDVEREKTLLMSRNDAGEAQNGTAEFGQVSGSGRYVAFYANATNLLGGAPEQVYVRDRREKTIRLASRAGNGDPADEGVAQPSISANGRWAAFYTGANNLGGNTDYDNAFRAGPIP